MDDKFGTSRRLTDALLAFRDVRCLYDSTMTETTNHPAKTSRFGRILPLIILLAGLGLFFVFGLQDYISFQTLKENREFLVKFVAEQKMLAILVYMLVYVIAIAFSLPGGLLLTVVGGFLFGAITGTIVVVIAATIGASLLFMATRSALGDFLRAKAGPWLVKLQDGFTENAFNYLLVLRLVPLFPFFIVNIVPAFLGMSLRTYVVGTLIGIIPGTAVFATFGAGIGSILDQGDDVSLAGVLTPQMIAGLVGLAGLALTPVIYKRIRRKS